MTPSRPSKTHLKVLAGILLGGGALWLALRGIAVEDLAAALGGVDPAWTLVALASTGLTLGLATVRWRLLFHPPPARLPTSDLFMALVVGQMVNIVSPLRVGELVRVYALSDRLKLSKTYVLATLAVEKALDMLLFGASVMLLIAVATIPAGVELRLGGRLAAAAAAFAALWLIARFAATLAPRLEGVLAWLPERWMARGREMLDKFVEGLSAIRQPQTGAWLIALSAAVLLSSALTNYLLLRAFAFNVPVWTALFLLVLHQIGFVPPSLPGKLGIFNYLTVVGLEAFGVDRPAAFSFSLVLYAVSYLPKVILGAAYAWLGSVRLTPR